MSDCATAPVCMARCSAPADLRFADLWLCYRHYQRVLYAARIALEEEHVQLYGSREWQPGAVDVIYYAQRVSDGQIKIGMTGAFRRRLAELRAEHGEMRLLLTHLGGSGDEAAMHQKFARLRTTGEFFRPRKPLMDWIIEIRQQQAPKALLPGTLPMAELLALARPKTMIKSKIATKTATNGKIY